MNSRFEVGTKNFFSLLIIIIITARPRNLDPFYIETSNGARLHGHTVLTDIQ